MLPRNERLGKTAFVQAFSQSRTFHHALLQMRVHYRQKNGDDKAQAVCKARVAFVVAKKLGRATVRNRIRRCLREAYRLSDYRLSDGRYSPKLQGVDIIFMVKAGALEAKPEELRAATDELLMRLQSGVRNRGIRAEGGKKKSANLGNQAAQELLGGIEKSGTESGS